VEPCFVYGAQATAYGIAKALEREGREVAGYVVTDMAGNPSCLEDKRVIPVSRLPEARVYVAVPEYLHREIVGILEGRGLLDYICVDSELEYRLMKSYYRGAYGLGFLPEESVALTEGKAPRRGLLRIYVAKSLHDKPLQGPVSFPAGCVTVQAGTALGAAMATDFHDNEGENISDRNGCYDELTVTYWAWKNSKAAVKGIAHYRCCLMITAAEREALLEHGSAITPESVRESVVESSDGKNIAHVPLREHMYVAKAPQSFYFGDIYRLYRQALADGRKFVDSAHLCHSYGFPLHLIKGPRHNMKITDPLDYYMCCAIFDVKEREAIWEK